ncbi:hypothetical protein [Paraburkholderia tropica]|uniref:hypothetical protein n=1 Tax=Paraburkholderia tropica TaxID=92647 RepID=UPI002AB03AC1|nr:hypothetical protein [Paraburkholderia tropica]
MFWRIASSRASAALAGAIALSTPDATRASLRSLQCIIDRRPAAASRLTDPANMLAGSGQAAARNQPGSDKTANPPPRDINANAKADEAQIELALSRRKLARTEWPMRIHRAKTGRSD